MRTKYVVIERTRKYETKLSLMIENTNHSHCIKGGNILAILPLTAIAILYSFACPIFHFVVKFSAICVCADIINISPINGFVSNWIILRSARNRIKIVNILVF